MTLESCILSLSLSLYLMFMGTLFSFRLLCYYRVTEFARLLLANGTAFAVA